MKQTPFYQKHIALGAKMAAFAGYDMPISYAGISEEHTHVRNNVGIFDVSHMGEFMLRGKNALALIQCVTTNDAAKLSSGQAQYSCMTNHRGGIVDDLLVYCIEPNDTYMLVVNASNIQKDWDWIKQHNTQTVSLENCSDNTCLLAIQGPNACKMLQPLIDKDILNLKYYNFIIGTLAGVNKVLISATGYTGSGGVEIYFEDKNNNASQIWDAIFEVGKKYNLQPIGLGARDTLRLEKGFCLYGNDIDDNTTPMESGLNWITKYTKKFTASDILQQQKAVGVQKKLVGFEMIERGIPRHNYSIKDAIGTIIGNVTSGTQAPSLGKAIGMGYVHIAYSSLDSEIFIDIRNTLIKAKVVKTPFE